MITKDMTILEVINTDRRTGEVFASIGMHCLGCACARGVSVEQAAAVHGVDPDALVKALNECVEKKS